MKSNEGYILCPNKNCNVYLKNYEIKHLLKPDDFSRYKRNCLQQIEALLGSQAFHCKTLDCIGFCKIEFNQETNKLIQKFFHCPICLEISCLECNAIHKGRTCFQYKRELEDSGLKAKHDKEEAELEELIKSGIVMKCPKCNIFLQRLEDKQCQYIRCFYCKMDICWLTRGPRWGPGV